MVLSCCRTSTTSTCESFHPLSIALADSCFSLAHFDRERIPERVVHAKGSGAHGEFTVSASSYWTLRNGLATTRCCGRVLTDRSRHSTDAGHP